MAKQPLPETESITLLTELLERNPSTGASNLRFTISNNPSATPRGRRPKPPTVDQLLRRVPPSTNTEAYLPLDLLLVTRDDLQQALERHGFTVEKVITRPVSYLKLTRADGEAFNLDSNAHCSNFNDSVWEGKVWEHRILPYDTGGCFKEFFSITWARSPEPGEVPPRLMQAWDLMQSSGPTDISPTRKRIQAEAAEKKRVAGLEEENKRLREELQAVYHRIVVQGLEVRRLIQLHDAKECCEQHPYLDTWDENDARRVLCCLCGKHTKSHFCRVDAIAEWEKMG